MPIGTRTTPSRGGAPMTPGAGCATRRPSTTTGNTASGRWAASPMSSPPPSTRRCSARPKGSPCTRSASRSKIEQLCAGQLDPFVGGRVRLRPELRDAPAGDGDLVAARFPRGGSRPTAL